MPADHPSDATPARRDAATQADGDIRQRLLAATTDLLGERRFDAISVADIIAAAGVSRASFYFYFANKQAVLAELVRAAVAAGQQVAQPWISSSNDPVAALRSGIAGGAELWARNAGVLRAIVESWTADESLRRLWVEQMASFTEATVIRIRADPAVLRRLDGQDVGTVAASLTWLGERLYYLAAAGVEPFTDRDVVVDTLTAIWTSVLYR